MDAITGRGRFARLGVLRRMASVRLAGSCVLALTAVVALPIVALAQSQPSSQQSPGAAAAAKKAAKPTAGAQSPARAGTDGAAPGDAGLRARVEQLEEQFVDLQVTIGTAESLTRPPSTASSSASFRGAQPSNGAGSAPDAARTEHLDIQVRALLQQVEQLTDRVRTLEGSPRTAAAGQRPAASPSAPSSTSTPAPAVAGFGQTTVTPASPSPPAGGRAVDSIGDILQTDGRSATSKSTPVLADGATAGTGATPKVLYEQGYNALLSQDYPAAEIAFNELLKNFPADNLAGNAQYWLGETFFYRGQFKSAAAAYYKGYQTYSRNAKAPDSLLKLAMSLDKLGQKDASCQSFAELATKFPTAAPQIKSRAQTETQRIGCPS